MSLEDVNCCLNKIFSPLSSNEERMQCYQLTEHYKETYFKLEDLEYLCSPKREAPVILFGLNCLGHRVKLKWASLSEKEKHETRQFLSSFVANFDNMVHRNSEGNAVCLVITQIMVHLIKCEWPQQWPSVVSELITLGKAGSLQSLVVFDIFRRLSEDVLFFNDVPIKRRRELCAVLSENVPKITHYALDSMFSAVKLHTSIQMDINGDTLSTLQSALMLLSAFFEWYNLTPLHEWKAPEQLPLPWGTMSSIQLLLFLLRLPMLRVEAADVLCVILANKQNSGVAEVTKSRTYTTFFAFTPGGHNPIDTILDISRSAFTTMDFTENASAFMRRWAEVIALLGTQVAEDFARPENKGSVAVEVLDSLIQANIFASIHPSRLFAISAGNFFKAVLSSKHAALISLLSNYMPKLLPVWMDNMILQPFPDSTNPMAEWMHANCEKEEYSNFLIKTRNFIKVKCLLLAASLWPAEVLRYLIDWHKRMLTEVPKSEDLILPSQPFINPASDLIRQWEALSFAMDKTISSACFGEELTCRATDAVVTTSSSLALSAERKASQSILLAHLRDCFAAITIAGLPADPGVRQYSLHILHTLVISCAEGGAQFILQLLMQDFATLRYNPYLKGNGLASAAAAPTPIFKYLNLRCQCVRDMHMCVAVDVFRLVRVQAPIMLPYFDSFCSELNDILTNRHGGLGEQCLLLEVVIYLALRLPCTFVEQREKLANILADLLTEWNNPESLLVVFGAEMTEPKENERNGETVGGLNNLMKYFGLQMDAQDIIRNTDFLMERNMARLKLRWVSLGTVAIMRRLNAALSFEQAENVAIPLIETLVGPAFNLLRTLNKLWLPETSRRCHPSMQPVLELLQSDKAMQCNVKPKDPVNNLSPEGLITLEYREVADEYLTKLQSFLAHLYESSIRICECALEITSHRFYALPTDQLNQLLYNYVCPDIDAMPDFRLLQLLRHLIIPYVRFCPEANIGNALVPLMPYVLDALFQKVNRSWNAVSLLGNSKEVDDEEATEEIFVDVTVRSLSMSLVEITRILLAFTGARTQRGLEDVKMEGVNSVDFEIEQEDSAAAATTASTPIQFGPVASALLLPDGGGGGEMFARIASWLIMAANWPDSKVCTKAATLLVKVIDYALQKDVPNIHLSLPPELATQLLIGGLQALRTNGQFLSEVGSPLFNLIGRSVAIIEGGFEAATTHLQPILLSALSSCQDSGTAGEQVMEVKKFTEFVFNKTKTPTERAIREHLKAFLQPIIGVPVAEQYKQALSISTLEPIKRPSLRSRRRQIHGESAEMRKELAVQALADLFGGS